MANEDDPVMAARRRQNAMLRRSSYFPAANLRQFEGTEFSPPGAGTYYKPGGAYANTPRAQRELAKAWQSDLAFNVMANPRMAQALEAERIGAQYGGGKSFAGKPGYQTVHLPSGGTTVVTDAEAKRLTKIPGYTTTVGMSRPSQAEAFNLGYYGQPTFTPRTAFERSYATGFTGGREGVGVTQPEPPGFGYQLSQQLGRIGTLGYNAIASLFSRTPRFAGERDDLNRDIENTFYGGGHAVPTPTPTSTPATTSRLATAPIGYQSDFMGTPAALQERFGQPRRYFDL